MKGEKIYMELYEALKNGTSKEDLIKAFTEELNAATAKIEEDKAAEIEKQKQDKKIADARQKATDALNEYFKLLGIEGDVKISNDAVDVSEIFKNAMKPFKSFSMDDDIISSFIKSL